MNTDPIEGGLYSTRVDDRIYGVLKILKIDNAGVHVRQYSNQFKVRPASLDPDTLFMAGIQREVGVKLGLGHTPVSHETFANWDIQFIQVEPTSREELEDYECWKEEGGGYF